MRPLKHTCDCIIPTAKPRTIGLEKRRISRYPYLFLNPEGRSYALTRLSLPPTESPQILGFSAPLHSVCTDKERLVQTCAGQCRSFAATVREALIGRFRRL